MFIMTPINMRKQQPIFKGQWMPFSIKGKRNPNGVEEEDAWVGKNKLKQGLKRAQKNTTRRLGLVRQAFSGRTAARGLHASELARTGGGAWLRFWSRDLQG